MKERIQFLMLRAYTGRIRERRGSYDQGCPGIGFDMNLGDAWKHGVHTLRCPSLAYRCVNYIRYATTH